MNLNILTYRSGANEENTFARSKPTYINAIRLQAGIEKSMPTPAEAAVCIFSAESDFYARPDSPAVLPLADVEDGSAPELNPAQWDVQDVSELHLIASEDTTVTLSFYK